jgi:hypothetical protein
MLLRIYSTTSGKMTNSMIKPRAIKNSYALGRIGQHNVVLAYLPGMGKGASATVAANFRASFHQDAICERCGALDFDTILQTKIDKEASSKRCGVPVCNLGDLASRICSPCLSAVCSPLFMPRHLRGDPYEIILYLLFPCGGHGEGGKGT